MFEIENPDGSVSKAATLDELRKHALLGEIDEDTIISTPSGLKLRADELEGLKTVFAGTSVGIATKQRPKDSIHRSHTKAVVEEPQVQLAPLFSRVVGRGIDAVVLMALLMVCELPGVGWILALGVAPVQMIYWLCRDVVGGPGQSLGKKVMGIRAERVDGRAFGVKESAKRNVVALAFLLDLVPVVGPILSFLIVIGFAVVDLVSAAQGKEAFCDRFAGTRVVKA